VHETTIRFLVQEKKSLFPVGPKTGEPLFQMVEKKKGTQESLGKTG